MNAIELCKEAIRSGTIASLAMMPAGFIFRFLDMRVGYYGPKVALALFGNTSPVVLFIQHIVIGWLSALPLVVLLGHNVVTRRPMLSGTIYGAFYYVLINSLTLPFIFLDATPWHMGMEFVFPSLVVHVIFGLAVGFVSRTRRLST